MPATITLEDVKKLLTAREQTINNLFSRVEAIDVDITYLNLKGSNGQSPPQLVGKSKKEKENAFALLRAVILNVGALADVMSAKRASYTQLQSATFKDQNSLEALYHALQTESVEIGALPVCSSGYNTLTPSGQKTRVEQTDLEKVLAVDLKAVEDTLRAFEVVFTSQTTLVETYKTRITTLTAQAKEKGLLVQGELDRAEEAIEQASATIKINPLEATDTFTVTVDPILSSVEGRLAAVQGALTSALKAINEAERKFRTLRPLSYECDQLWINVQQHIASPTTMPRADQNQIDSLRASLTSIEQDRLTATPQSIQARLTVWNQEADLYEQIENAAYTAYQALVQERLGLVARLTAFTGEAKGSRVYDHESLLPIAQEALRLLGPRMQTPIEEVTQLVSLYEQTLHSLLN